LRHDPVDELEQPHHGGRWVLIADRHMAGGGIAGLRIDITDLKHAEREAQAARQRMADFAEAANDWFWESDTDGRMTYLSEPFETATGIPIRDRIGEIRIDLQ